MEHAIAIGDQRDGARSLTSNASHVPPKAVLPSTRPTIVAPKHDSSQPLVTTIPAQVKVKDVMRENRKRAKNDLTRKEMRLSRNKDMRAEGPTDVEKPGQLVSPKQKAKKWSYLPPARGLQMAALTPRWPDSKSEAGKKESTDGLTEETGATGKFKIAGKPMNREARIHSPDGLAMTPVGSTNKAVNSMTPNDQVGLFDKVTDTETEKDPTPAIIPILPSSRIWIRMAEKRARVKHRNEKPYHTAQPKASEGYAIQPIDNTKLACEPLVEQNLATVKDLSIMPQQDLQTLNATPDPASQDCIRNNPFQRRLQQLVGYLASEGGSSPDNTSSTIDSDDASSRSDNSAGHSGYQYHDGAPNGDSPDSSHNAHSHTKHTVGNTSLTSCNQSSNSSSAVSGPNPTQGYGDNERVRTDALRTQNGQQNGKVIPCPLRLELKCTGMDDNMSSLL